MIVFLRLLARAIAADGARYGEGDGPVRVDLGKSGPIDIPRAQRRPPSLLRLGDIVDGQHAALAAGDRPRMLAQVPAAHLTRTPPTTVERVYLLQHILGLQSLARATSGGHALLVEALKGTKASEMVQGARDFALFIASPHIELALFHRESDEDAHLKGIPAFDHSLRNALVLHPRYWRDLEPNPGERQQAHPWGFIALGPLAWATMRRDAGLPVRIASDYLPESLLRANRGGGQS